MRTHCAILLILIAALAVPMRVPVAAAGEVTIEAECLGAEAELADPSVKITITNESKRPLTVAHIAAMLGPDTTEFYGFTVAPGTTWTGAVPSGLPVDGAESGAIVTTDAGVAVVTCGQDPVVLDPAPRDPDLPEDGAAIAAETLSILESRREFEALYTLLHPDARELVSYEQMACWYLDFLSDQSAQKATVTEVVIGPWTWGVTAETYEETAEIAYVQGFASADGSEKELSLTMHLVRNEGVWRWFLGTDPTWLGSLPVSCSIGGVQIGTEDLSGSSSDPLQCIGSVNWWNDSQQRLRSAEELVGGLDEASDQSDAPALREAARQVARMAEEQAASSPPAAAQELNELYVELIVGYAMVLEQTAASLDSSQSGAADAAEAAREGVDELLATEISPATNIFLAACP